MRLIQNWTWNRFTEINKQLKAKGTLDTVMFVSPEGILYSMSSAIYSAKDYAMRSSNHYQNGTIYDFRHSSEKESGITFSGYDRYAMNVNSTVKMEAWDYLKFLLSYEIQTQSKSGMFPVNIAANEKEFTDLIEGKLENTKGNGGKGGNITVSAASLEPLKQMDF